MKTIAICLMIGCLTLAFGLALEYGIEKTLREPTREEIKARQRAMATEWRTADIPITSPEEYRNVKLQRRKP